MNKVSVLGSKAQLTVSAEEEAKVNVRLHLSRSQRFPNHIVFHL